MMSLSSLKLVLGFVFAAAIASAQDAELCISSGDGDVQFCNQTEYWIADHVDVDKESGAFGLYFDQDYDFNLNIIQVLNVGHGGDTSGYEAMDRSSIFARMAEWVFSAVSGSGQHDQMTILGDVVALEYHDGLNEDADFTLFMMLRDEAIVIEVNGIDRPVKYEGRASDSEPQFAELFAQLSIDGTAYEDLRTGQGN